MKKEGSATQLGWPNGYMDEISVLYSDGPCMSLINMDLETSPIHMESFHEIDFFMEPSIENVPMVLSDSYHIEKFFNLITIFLIHYWRNYIVVLQDINQFGYGFWSMMAYLNRKLNPISWPYKVLSLVEFLDYLNWLLWVRFNNFFVHVFNLHLIEGDFLKSPNSVLRVVEFFRFMGCQNLQELHEFIIAREASVIILSAPGHYRTARRADVVSGHVRSILAPKGQYVYVTTEYKYCSVQFSRR